MPKQTFFNLPEDKKEILIQAVEKEFSRVPLFEASIANMVQDAGIPRGSFYQYFENKEDAFFYLLKEHTKERQANFISLLKQHDGDLFKAMAGMFHNIISDSPDNLPFIRNALLNMTHKVEHTFAGIFSSSMMDDSLDEFSPLINKKYLNISEDKELFYVMQILTSVTIRNFIEKFSRNLTDEQAICNYTTELQLLKYGLYSKEEEES
ncbi:TetR/AcrR family transcriptional regulator [Virgibacillus oceani]